MKKQIGVIFGSRSCEREVAIISAIQLMRHADTEQYDVIPRLIPSGRSKAKLPVLSAYFRT